VAIASHVKLEYSFKLYADEACYKLSIECQQPIDIVCIRGDVATDLFESDQSGGVILSRSEGDPNNPLLATYRFQEPSSRFDIKMRTTESTIFTSNSSMPETGVMMNQPGSTNASNSVHGTLSVFVLTKSEPKVARMVTIPIKPLSLHHRISSKDRPYKNAPMIELVFSGDFSANDIHSWIGMCVDDFPRPRENGKMKELYKSTFLDTILEIHASKSEAIFRSDSASTICIIRDVLSRQATSRKILINMKVNPAPASYVHFLNLISRRLEYQHTLATHVQLLDPLKELAIQEPDMKDWIAQDLEEILSSEKDIRREFANQPRRLSFLHNIIHDLNRSKHRLEGNQFPSDKQDPQLQKYLQACDMENIFAFFKCNN